LSSILTDHHCLTFRGGQAA